MIKNAIAMSCVVLALSACGYNRGERALSGAAIGAGAGAGALGAGCAGRRPRGRCGGRRRGRGRHGRFHRPGRCEPG